MLNIEVKMHHSLFKKITTVFLFSLLFLALSVGTVSADNGNYRIDFGTTFFPMSATGWNDVLDTQSNNTTTVYSLVDSTGDSSSATLQITNGFGATFACNGNNNGTTSSTEYPANATRDSFFVGNCSVDDTSATLVFGGLQDGATYDFTFYASRMAGDSTNRTADYTIGGTTVSLNATNNVNGVVNINGVSPTSGTITVQINKNASASFGYIGVIEVVGNNLIPDNIDPVANAGTDQAITLPTSSTTLNGSASDDDGTIASYAWSEITPGGATIESPSSATTVVSDLSYGTHTFRLTVTDDVGGVDSDDIDVVVSEQNLPGCFPKSITIVGSSTAAGSGTTTIDNSWVNLYLDYLQVLDASNSITNLAVAGLNTYNALPTGTVSPGRPSVDPTRNITAAIATAPDAIIVNLPTNDAGNGYALSETQANFTTIANEAIEAEIPIWFTTSQPRDLDAAGRTNLISLRDWILDALGPNVFDFWSVIANPDGTINGDYAFGDGIHLNDLGHRKLYSRVSGSEFLTQVCDANAPIISSLASDPDTTAVDITWNTNEEASTQVEYGLTASYGSTTTLADTLPRVTSHSVELTGLDDCTTYHYRVLSKDWNYNSAASSDQMFTTDCIPEPSPSPSPVPTPSPSLEPSPEPSPIPTPSPSPSPSVIPSPSPSASPLTEQPQQSSSSFSAPAPAQPPGCSDQRPSSAPSLFQGVTSGTSVALYFTPVSPRSYYAVSYGTSNNAEGFGYELQNNSDGVISAQVHDLLPNATYYFKVRGGNGCQPGDWSEVLAVRTGSNNQVVRTTTLSSSAVPSENSQTVLPSQQKPDDVESDDVAESETTLSSPSSSAQPLESATQKTEASDNENQPSDTSSDVEKPNLLQRIISFFKKLFRLN